MSKLKRKVTIRHNNGMPVKLIKFPERNEQCPCLSGKKFKNCHINDKQGLIEIVKQIHETLKNRNNEQQSDN